MKPEFVECASVTGENDAGAATVALAAQHAGACAVSSHRRRFHREMHATLVRLPFPAKKTPVPPFPPHPPLPETLLAPPPNPPATDPVLLKMALLVKEEPRRSLRHRPSR